VVDVVDPATRSRMMSGIRGKDTRPERELRSALWKKGLRYRIHVSGLPGRPDLVFAGRNAVVMVHGCFWHGHAGCRYFKVPATRPDFWIAKFEANRLRDIRDLGKLQSQGWRVFRVWECAIRHFPARTSDALADLIGDRRISSADIRFDGSRQDIAVEPIHALASPAHTST
jgi:DNA mismatch endonuclease (patch repair protein)